MKVDSVHLTTEIEPSVLAMSDTYIAVGFNNRALYYRIQSNGGSFVDFEWNSPFDERVAPPLEVTKASEHDYLGTITELHINSQYAAAFMNGRIQLHTVREKRRRVALDSFVYVNCRLKNPINAVRNVSRPCFH